MCPDRSEEEDWQTWSLIQEKVLKKVQKQFVCQEQKGTYFHLFGGK